MEEGPLLQGGSESVGESLGVPEPGTDGEDNGNEGPGGVPAALSEGLGAGAAEADDAEGAGDGAPSAWAAVAVSSAAGMIAAVAAAADNVRRIFMSGVLVPWNWRKSGCTCVTPVARKALYATQSAHDSFSQRSHRTHIFIT
jgi:hypothetical protein